MDGPSEAPSQLAEREPELLPISLICGGRVVYMTEAGQRFIFMEGLRFLVRGAQKQMDALLALNHPNASYPTKLWLNSCSQNCRRTLIQDHLLSARQHPRRTSTGIFLLS